TSSRSRERAFVTVLRFQFPYVAGNRRTKDETGPIVSGARRGLVVASARVDGLVHRFVRIAGSTTLRNGVTPMPPAKRTAGRLASPGRTRSPKGPSMVTVAPNFIVFRQLLKAESRIRVVIMTSASSGALAIENVRVFPFASLSGGSICPNET